MLSALSHRVAELAEKALPLYHRLVVVVGAPRSGKTAAFRELHATLGWPLINLNLALSEKLLELTVRQRALRVGRLVDDIVQEHDQEHDAKVVEPAAKVVMLDNIEMLFHPDLQQDPLRLLQHLSRNRTIVAAWRGAQLGRSLLYAAPEHPEYRRFDDPEALIVPTTQEHSA